MENILIGLAVGYLIASVCESFYHRISGHASVRMREWCGSLGVLGDIVRDRWYSHSVIHHYSTFKQSHVIQFMSVDEQKRLSKALISTKNKHIVEQDFGLRVGAPVEYLYYMAPTAPFTILACYLGGPWFSLGAIVSLLLLPLMSEFVHPLLHLPYEKALKTAHPILRPFLKSRYFKFLARYHCLHHMQPEVNFNLLLGGDWLFGRFQLPNDEESQLMSNMGLR